MEYRKFINKFVVRIDKGEEILTKIKELCKKENIKLGQITGLGATNDVTIGLFDTEKKEYFSQTLKKEFEISSLIGNISTMNDEVYLHLHINLSDINGNTFGGHLSKCVISATCEIIIDSIAGEVKRELNKEIGLNLYKFYK
ncbi:MAG: DNA-binding protein [Clostridia bacterium]|nr:DNA-binding protein [Clostridia bacterium]